MSASDNASYVTLADGVKVKVSTDIQKWGAWCQINISPFIQPHNLNPSNRPTFDVDDLVIRYACAENGRRGLTEEIYRAIPARYHQLMGLVETSAATGKNKTNFSSIVRCSHLYYYHA